MSKTSGYVEKRSNSLRIAFYYHGELLRETVRLNGVILTPTKAHFNYAARMLATINDEIARGTFNYAEHFPESPRAASLGQVRRVGTFGELAALWLDSKGKLEPATRDQYATAVRFWLRLFGADTLLTALDHKIVESKIGKYEWPSAKTHNNYMIALRGIFGMEYRGANAVNHPCNEIENMPVVKRLPDPLTREERDRVLADMRERYDVRVFAYYQFMFYSGMRPEEAIALRWSDIDFSSGTARVQRVRTFKGSERDGSKTHSVRDVDLVPEAMRALDLLKPFTYMLRVERENEDDAADVFQNPVTRKAWHDERSQRDHYWKPCLKRLGIRARRSYCTRHTYCTIALRAGVPPAYIAAQAGHSVQMLLTKYALPGAEGDGMKRLLAAAMSGENSPISPQNVGSETKSLNLNENFGRRDWTRTKPNGSTGV